MLDVHMLFSGWVDADFLDTAQHLGEERPVSPSLQPEGVLEILRAHLRELNQRIDAAAHVLRMRRML